jgi:hypothetical protein
MDEELRAELLSRMEKDQVARKALDLKGMLEADRENLPWLKGVIAQHGWPGASLAGTDGAHAAWLLAQHADADPAFQRQCLDLMTAAVEAGEATRRELAYLTDRVLLAEGQPQVYGTQMTREGIQYVPRNLRDPENVDQRRAAVGLEPIAEYQRRFDAHPTGAAQMRCRQCGEWVPLHPPDGGGAFTVTCTCGHEARVRLGRAARPGGGTGA